MSFGSTTSKTKETPFIGGPLHGGELTDGRGATPGDHTDVVTELRRTKEEKRRAALTSDERGKLDPLAPVTAGESLARNQRLRTRASKTLGVS